LQIPSQQPIKFEASLSDQIPGNAIGGNTGLKFKGVEAFG
jgi:hypothetical protein